MAFLGCKENVVGGGDYRDCVKHGAGQKAHRGAGGGPAYTDRAEACRDSSSAKPYTSGCRRIGWGDAGMKRRVLLREPIGVALETLRAHKMRSFLMLLGIILSVSTLIVVIALISGVNRYIADRVANMGSNVFLLTRFPVITDVEEYVKANRRNKKVTWDDFEALRDNMKLPLRVGVELRIDSKVPAGSHSLNDTNIRGVTANMADIDPTVPRDGRYISEGDDQSRAQVTMIGNDLPARLFPGVDPIAHELLIEGRPFLIFCIVKTIGTAFGQSQDNFAYIPIQTY